MKPYDLTADRCYPLLKQHIIQTTGLSYYDDKDTELARRVQRRVESLNLPHCSAYFDILTDFTSGAAEMDALIAEITIGETYFFRHPEHFAALREIVLPELMAQRRVSRTLRIWCAGCADGPEAYSLAILLKGQMASELADWDVQILGTDINRRSLARAREGLFTDWALRAIDPALKRGCFTADGHFWRIAAQYRQDITFEYHNLVEDPCLPPAGRGAFDLIVCRNVMIYFAPEAARRIVEHFQGHLGEGSWLLVGPSETNMTVFSTLSPVNAPGATFYRNAAARAVVGEPVGAAMARSAPAVAPAATAAALACYTLDDVRLLADRGDWLRAVQCCEYLLRQDNLNPLVHFYYGLILEQSGRHAEAEPALRRAIYLDRQAVLPHYYLGLVLQSRGDPRQAARFFGNAVALLQWRCESDVFADADGITAGEMKKLAELQLRVLNACQ